MHVGSRITVPVRFLDRWPEFVCRLRLSWPTIEPRVTPRLVGPRLLRLRGLVPRQPLRGLSRKHRRRCDLHSRFRPVNTSEKNTGLTVGFNKASLVVHTRGPEGDTGRSGLAGDLKRVYKKKISSKARAETRRKSVAYRILIRIVSVTPTTRNRPTGWESITWCLRAVTGHLYTYSMTRVNWGKIVMHTAEGGPEPE
jgi:hypothetical protein